MNIITEDDAQDGIPNAVGTPNATEDVYHHVKPGRTRANFFRYFRFNLPRLTKALLLLIIAAIGVAAAFIAVYAKASGFNIFPHADIALWLVVALAAVYLVLGIFTRLAIWDFGSLVCAAAAIVYLGGSVFGQKAPFVWNGATIELAATWNVLFLASLVYFVLNWAVNFGILVVWPKTQGFTD